MKALHKRPVLRKTVATGLFVFGVVALVVPLIPGWVMIGVGLYLLSIDSPKMQGAVLRYRTRYASFDRLLKHSYDQLERKRTAPTTEEQTVL